MTVPKHSKDRDKGKSKPQLIAEIEALRSRVREFELEPKTYKRSNHLLRSFIDVLPDCGCSFDAHGNILEILAGKASSFHSIALKLKGQSIHNFLPKQDAEPLLAAIKETIETKRPRSFEFEFSVLMGRRWFIAKTMTPDKSSTGNPIINCILEDITDQKITAGSLKDVKGERDHLSLEKKEEENKFRALVEGSLQGIAVTKNRRILFANQALADLLGFDGTEKVLALDTFDKIIVQENRELLRERAEARIHGEDVSAFYDTTYLGRDGNRIDVSILNSVIEWEGEPAILTTIINITERKIVEEELKKSEQRFKDFAEISSDWFWEMGPNLHFTWFSDRVEEVTGVPAEFHMGKTRQNLAAKGEEREKWDRHLKDLENRKPYRNFTYWREGPDGNLQYMTSSGVPVFDEKRNFLGYRGTGSNITKQKQAEDALLDNETRLQNFIDLAPSNLVYIDKNFRYRQVNARYLDFLGLSKEEVINHTIIEVLGEEDFQRYLPRIKKVLQGQEQHFEVPGSVSLKDLEFRDLELRFVPSVDSGGRVMGFYASIQDISERKRAETSLIESNKNLSEALKTLDMAIEAMSSGFALWDRNNELVICNNHFRNLYPAVKHLIVPGVKFEQIIRASVQTGEVLDAVGQEEDWIQKRLGTHRNPSSSVFYKLATGRWIQALERKTPEGGIVGERIDITELKRAEEALREREAQLRTFIDLSPSILVYIDRDLVFRQVNQGYLTFVGKSEEEVIGHTIVEVLGEDAFELNRVAIEEVFQGKVQLFEVDHSVGDLGVRNLEVRYVPHFEEDQVKGYYGSVQDITERKRSQEALIANQQLLQTVFDTIPVGVFVKDQDGKVIMANEAHFESLDLTPLDLLGKDPTILGIGRQEEKQAMIESDRIVMEQGKRFEGRGRSWTMANGETRWWDVFKVPLQDQAGNIIGIVGSRMDVTEHKRAEEALQESLSNLNKAQQMAMIGSWRWDLVSNEVEWSDEMYRQYGYDVGEVEPNFELAIAGIHPDDVSETMAIIEKGLQSGRVEPFRYRMGDRHFLGEGTAELDSEGNQTHMIGTVQDITDQIRAEEELRSRQMLLQAVFDTVPIWISVRDKYHRFVMVNRQHVKDTGISEDEYRNMRIDQIPYINKSESDSSISSDNRVLETGETLDIPQWESHLPNDQTRFHHTIKVPFRSGDGEISGIIAVTEDVTDQIRAEEALRKSEELLKAIFNNSPTLISLKDLEGRYLLVNQRFEEWSGIPLEKVIGYTTHDVHPKELADQLVAQDMEVLQTGKVIVGEVFIGPGEHDYRVNTKFPVLEGNGKIVGVGTIGTNISERRQAENRMKLQQQQLIQADKMASLGIMVAGVAHEINNPNGFIMFNAPIIASIWNDAMPILKRYQEESGELTLGSLPYDKALKAMPNLLAAISSGAERIKNIVDNLKDFARQDLSEEFKPVNLNDVLASAVALLNNEIKKNTKHFSVKYGADLPEVLGEFQKIEQVVINLITNSCQALPNPEKAVRVKTDYDAKSKTVRLTVADEGEGISPENLAKIMDPFFTTKRDSGGTGLGLSVSYSIMEEHGGRLEFSSTEGKSTTAIMSFPLNELPHSKATGNS